MKLHAFSEAQSRPSNYLTPALEPQGRARSPLRAASVEGAAIVASRRARSDAPYLVPVHAGPRNVSAPGPAAAFTLIEYVITIMLTVLVFGALMIFSEGTGRALVSITTQSSDNQSVGNSIEFIFSRIRLANSATNVDSSGLVPTGNILQLTFDDNPDVDSDGDGITWNDKDHTEQFIYKSTDTNYASLDDNYICYKTNATGSTTNIIIPSYVRKLSGANIFSVSSNSVSINFGLLTTNATPFSQAIEIRTKVNFRNKLQ